MFYHNFSAMGAAYGTAKSGVGIAAMAIMKPELIMRSVIPVVMAGIIAIYGVVVAVLITNSINASGTNMMKVTFVLEPFLTTKDFIEKIYFLGFHKSWRRTFCRSLGSRCWYGHWNRWGRWSPRDRSTAKTFCRNGFDSHFCGSFGSLRSYYRSGHDVHQIR